MWACCNKFDGLCKFASGHLWKWALPQYPTKVSGCFVLLGYSMRFVALQPHTKSHKYPTNPQPPASLANCCSRCCPPPNLGRASAPRSARPHGSCGFPRSRRPGKSVATHPAAPRRRAGSPETRTAPGRPKRGDAFAFALGEVGGLTAPWEEVQRRSHVMMSQTSQLEVDGINPCSYRKGVFQQK